MGEEILVHHGIKGQKWGIRRFQNPDGSRTAEGRQRYGYSAETPKSPREELSEHVNRVVNNHSIRNFSNNISTIRKENAINKAKKTAKYNQQYWEDQAKITEKYIKMLERGERDSDFESKKEVKDAIKIEKENLKKYQQFAKDWIDSQNYLNSLSIEDMTVEEVNKKTSKSAMINNHSSKWVIE